MKKYHVDLYVPFFTIIEVEAEDEGQAEDLAKEMAWWGDIDWNSEEIDYDNFYAEVDEEDLDLEVAE